MVNFMLRIFYHNKKELHESRNLGKRTLSQSFPFGYVTNIGDHCNECLGVVKEHKAWDPTILYEAPYKLGVPMDYTFSAEMNHK